MRNKISYDRRKQLRVIENSLKTLTFPEKIYNFILNRHEIKYRKTRLKSKPLYSVFSPISVCNYRCKFCESNSQYEGVTKIFPNSVTAEEFKRLNFFDNRTIAVFFYGNAGEPLLNKDLVKIARKLKKKGIFLSITTNGSQLNREVADGMAKIGFDDVIVSFHEGKKETYEEIQSKTFDRVTENVSYLTKVKKRFPMVLFNFALNKINAPEIEDFVNLAEKLKIDGVLVNHYYHCKNAFKEDISFAGDPETGNKYIDKTYQLGYQKNLMLHPIKKPYLKKKEELENSSASQNARPGCRCVMPYRNLNFYGSFKEKDTFEVCVCNRVFLFKLNYRDFMGQDIDLIWNHPMLQYMRKTLGKNPVCSFCQSKDTPHLRNTDNKKYIQLRDKCIRDFLKEAAESADIKPVKGLAILDKNIYGES